MKKFICAVFFIISFIIFPLFQSSLSAEMSVGASTWYCWWKASGDTNDMNLKPTLLYGPAASVRINDSWSIAGVFLYGQFTGKENTDGSPDNISRFDSDLSLNYNINRYFKLFGGGKLMGFNWDSSQDSGKHWSAGPGLGIGSTLPLVSNLYLLLNLSGTYSWGKHDGDNNGDNNNGSIKENTFNTNASLAYYFASASTSVNLGFRYQYLFIDNPGENKNDTFYFYGGTLSVVYSF
ncbi:MAG: hypothetical protein V1874_06725 [Spirochaetota bacterium]